MAQGLGGNRIRNPHIGRLAQAIAARGQGSLSAAAADGVQLLSATKPQPATGNEPKVGIGTGLPVTKPPKPAPAPGGKTQTTGGFHPWKVLEDYKPGKPLSGKEMREYARALAVTETKPQIHGYAGLVRESEKAKKQEAAGLGKLGARTSGNVSDVYSNIAKSEAENIARQQALGSQLTTNAAGIASTSNAELAAQQSGALGSYESQLAQRGAPSGGGAQEALAQAVAAQTAAQSTDNQAAQQFAASQAANSNQLAAAMAGSAAMQGGSAVGAINRDTVNRVGESNQRYDQSINGLREKLGEAKSAFGTDFAKNLLSLRGNEQKFILGKDAVAGNKEKLSAEKEAAKAAAAEANAAAAAKTGENAQDQSNADRQFELELKKFGLAEWEAKHPNAASGEAQKQQKKLGEEVKEVKTLIPTIVTELGKVPKGTPPNKVLQTYIAKVNSTASANPTVVAKVLKAWWNKGYGERLSGGVNPFG
jgi:hypothetical protein